MVDYYKTNGIYEALKNTAHDFHFVSGNSWILVYGNKKDNDAKVIVLVHGDSWKEDLNVIETLKNINQKANIPVCRLSFDDSENALIENIEFYKSIYSKNKTTYSLTDFKKYLKNIGLDIIDGKCDKYLNDKTSSAYHKWQRNTLGNKIIVSDLDLIRVDYKTKMPTEFLELKRSTADLNKWTPYSDDFINFNLVKSISKKLNIPLTILYNKMEKDINSKIISKDITDYVSIFSFDNNSTKKLKVNYDFKSFCNGDYLYDNVNNDIINKNIIKNKMKFWKGDEIVDLKEGQIFVFGSNPAGFHGAGAAKAAMKFGAKYGIGRGIQGNTYALITKNLKAGFTEKGTGIKYEKEGFQSVSKDQISKNIDELYECVRNNPDKMFIIVYKNETWDNGSPKKSLNGYTGEEMFELFTKDKDVPPNIAMHETFKPLAKNWLENKQSLIKESEEKFTFFWKSTSPFSQWHPAIFEYKGIKFTSCEQFMLYSKAKLFGDEEIANKILSKNDNPLIQDFLNNQVNRYDIIDDYKTLRIWDTIQKEIKDLGKEVKNFNEEVWVSKRESIIAVANREKYKQNPDLKYKLMQTTGTTLVESSKFDRLYGIGLEETDPKAQDRKTWNGLNILGRILTDTRVRFENENKPSNKIKF